MTQHPSSLTARASHALLTAMIVLATILIAPAAAHADEVSVTDASLTWGVKESFRNYIRTTAHGEAVLGDGAVENADGTYDFPALAEDPGSYDPDSRALVLRFDGSIHFTGHGGTLDLRISSPRVEIVGSEGTLYATMSSNDTSGVPREYGEVALATLQGAGSRDVSEGDLSWSGIRASLTESGVQPFAGFYAAGQLLDPVSITAAGGWPAEEIAEETWTEPGQAGYLAAEARTAVPGVTQVFADEERGVIFALTGSYWADGVTVAPAVHVLDAETMEQRQAPIQDSRMITGIRGILPSGGFIASAANAIVVVRLVDGEYRVAETLVTTTTGTSQYAGNQIGVDPMTGAIYVAVPSDSSRTPITLHGRGVYVYEEADGAYALSEVLAPPSDADVFTSDVVFAVDPDSGVVTLFASAKGKTLSLTGRPADGASRAYLDDGEATIVAEGTGTAVARAAAHDSTSGRSFLWAGSTGELLALDDGRVVARAEVPAVHYLAGSIAVDQSSGLVYLVSNSRSTVTVVDGRAPGDVLPVLGQTEFGTAHGAAANVAVGAGGVPHVLLFSSLPYNAATAANQPVRDKLVTIQRVETPTVSEQPQSTTARLVTDEIGDDGSLGAADPQAVTFTAAASGSPEPSVQWQKQTAFGWQDLEEDAETQGVRTTTLTVQATESLDGVDFRAIVRNSATTAFDGEVEVGAIASDEATLSVEVLGTPVVTEQPSSLTVSAGRSAVFTVAGLGVPDPEITWQRKSGSGWSDLASRSPYTIDGGTLAVAASASLNGAVFRARLSNDAGEAFSSEATLTVGTASTDPTTYTGVVLEWSGSSEWQAAPPNGSTAHYFSAGVSGGTRATYSAKEKGVEILQRTSSRDVAATWNTRGAHVGQSGASQVVRLTEGTATVQPNGAAVIEWPTAFSVNFYDGLVPFTMENLKLTVTNAGRGTLTADLRGYSGDMLDPDKPKEPVVPASGVVVATFANVTVDTANGFVLRPQYSGVRIAVPSGETAQVTSGSGWGAWPQRFVDFHFTTGLAGYFYSTGGTFDPRKAPAGIAIGFAGATVPTVPVDDNAGGTGGGKAPGGAKPTVPALDGSGVVQGSLVWGVKASFRSYISGPVAKGAISVSGGAGTQNGLFRFGQASTDWKQGAAHSTTAYRGAVRFTGHSGILDLTFSEPTVRIDSPTRGTLLVRVNGGAHVELGTIALGSAARSAVDGGVSYTNAPVTLTAAGANVFSYGSSRFYPAGTAMDPVSFVIGATAAPGSGDSSTAVAAYTSTEWSAPAEPPANTGLYIDPEALGDIRPGSEITVVGRGFEPDESEIKVVLYSEPVVLDQDLTADSDGVATWTGLIPLDTEPGEHTLTFQGSVDLGIDITVLEAEETVGCVVTDGTLNWGFKESFRSYISGTIAHGEWETAGGASYETPEFAWSDGEGAFDPESFTGRVSFRGEVRFTGHDGLLDTTVADPTLLFTGFDTAYLLLDVSGLTMEDALAGNTDNVLGFEQVEFVTLDLSGGEIEVSDDGASVTATAVPTAITSQGYEAFPNYDAGTAFDPVSFTIQTENGCAAAAAEEPEQAEALSVDDEPVAQDEAGLGWLVWTGGGIAAAGLVAALAIWLIGRRRREGAGAEEAGLRAEGSEHLFPS